MESTNAIMRALITGKHPADRGVKTTSLKQVMRWPSSHRALPSSRAALRNQVAEATSYFAGVQRDPHFFWYSWLQDVNSQPGMNGSKSTDTNGKARTFPQQPQRSGTQLRNVSSFLAKKNMDRIEIVGSFCLNEKEKYALHFNIFFHVISCCQKC